MSEQGDETVVHIHAHAVDPEHISRLMREQRVREARSEPCPARDDPIADALFEFRAAALVVAELREKLDAVKSMEKELHESRGQLESLLGDAHVALSKASNRLGEAVTGGLFKARSVFL